MKNVLITGGAGFIGSHLVKFFVKNYADYNIINIDNLTYAGDLNNLKEIEDQPNYKFIKKDICNFSEIKEIFISEKIDGKLGRKLNESIKLIKYVDDRLGHDRRYAIDSSKIKNELGWEPKNTFDKGIDKTIDWYINKLT